MKDEKFIIRAYGKSELAMLYFPKHSTDAAMRNFRLWLETNPRLRSIRRQKGHFYTPKQVKKIVEEVGEPFEIEWVAEFN